MSKISTLLVTAALVAPTLAWAQGPTKRVASPSQISATSTYKSRLQQELTVEDPSLMRARPYTPGQQQTLSPNGKTAAVAPIQLATSSNALTAIRASQNQVVAVDSLDMVAFIHRQDITIWGGGTNDNGKYRYDVSIDGGSTFNNDIGALQTVFTNYGRYPQITAYKTPTAGAGPLNANFVWNGPTNRFPTPGWIGHVYGFADVATSGSPASTEHYLFDNEATLLPGGLCQGQPGEFWTVDFQFDGTNVMDSIYVMKGTYNSSTDDIDWVIAHRVAPGYDKTADGTATAIGPNIAFSPDGQHGWIGILSNIGTDPKNSTIFPVFFHSTDGGDTWGAPVEVDLDQFAWIADSLQSLWVDSLGNPASSGEATTAFDFDITVDNYGQVHMGVVIGTTGAGQAFSISSGLAKFYADVHSTPTGWDVAYIAPVLTFRGEFGTPNVVTQDNFAQISRTEDGSIIFYSWADSDTAQFTGNMNGVGLGVSDNIAPNLRIGARRVVDGAMAYPKLVTDGDLVWEGRMLIPTMAPTVIQTGNRYELPIVALELLQNDANLQTQFWYFGKDAYFEFGGGESEWCDPSGMNLGWSSWAFAGGNTACTATSQNPIDGQSDIVLHQSFPNPTAGNTVIRFELPAATELQMDLVNIYGQQVGVLAQGSFKAGVHDVTVSSSELAAGVYFYNLRAEGKVITKKMIVTK